jgi:hypothetical protein
MLAIIEVVVLTPLVVVKLDQMSAHRIIEVPLVSQRIRTKDDLH